MRTLWFLCVTTLCVCERVCVADKAPPEEDGVLQLQKGTFHRALRKYKQLLVHFYVPLSGESLRLSGLFKSAAAELRGSEVKMAAVDVTKEKELVKDLNVTAPSNIRLYVSGDKHNPVLCPVPQSSASIVTWLRRRAGSAADLLGELGQWEASDELQVVGFFKELDSDYVRVFYAAAVDLPDVGFAVTQNDDVVSKYGLTHDVVLLLRKSKLIQAYKMMPQTSKEELVIFITVYQMDAVTEYTGETAAQILALPVLNHALLFANKSSSDFQELDAAFKEAAAAFRTKIVFVLVNVDEHRNGRMMEYFQVRTFEAPLVRLVNLTNHVTYHLPSDILDAETVKKFCQSYLDGNAKPKLQSEPVPEGWDRQRVKQLVGETLEKVAFNPNRTVLVLFYLPYSVESRALFPLLEEVAEAFSEQEDVVVARIDASANDINLSTQRRYPAVCLFPALYAERMVIYTGEMKVEDLLKFVRKEMKIAQKDRVKEDEDRRKYIEAAKAKDAKKRKDEL